MQEGKIIQSVAKAMCLLDLLAASERPMTLAERVVAFTCQNSVFTATFQSFRRVLFCITKDAKTTSERLHWISVFLDHCINQSTSAGADS